MRRSNKRLWLSFDEWNVWYRARSGQATNGQRQAAPHLLEEVYNLEDALVGGSINTLLRNSDRVRVACQAKLVNVIVPLVTSRTTVLRQSIYDPCGWALRDARAVGRSMRAWSPRHTRLARRDCRPTSRATTECRSSTSRLTTPRRNGCAR